MDQHKLFWNLYKDKAYNYKFKILQEIGRILSAGSKGELLRILGMKGVMTNDVMITMTVGMTAGMTVAMIIGMIAGKFYTGTHSSFNAVFWAWEKLC